VSLEGRFRKRRLSAFSPSDSSATGRETVR
jgi:hypothetical protein